MTAPPQPPHRAGPRARSLAAPSPGPLQRPRDQGGQAARRVRMAHPSRHRRDVRRRRRIPDHPAARRRRRAGSSRTSTWSRAGSSTARVADEEVSALLVDSRGPRHRGCRWRPDLGASRAARIARPHRLTSAPSTRATSSGQARSRRHPVTGARSDQQLGVRDLARQRLAVREREQRVVRAVDHEGRRGDVGEPVPARRAGSTRYGLVVPARRSTDQARVRRAITRWRTSSYPSRWNGRSSSVRWATTASRSSQSGSPPAPRRTHGGRRHAGQPAEPGVLLTSVRRRHPLRVVDRQELRRPVPHRTPRARGPAEAFGVDDREHVGHPVGHPVPRLPHRPRRRAALVAGVVAEHPMAPPEPLHQTVRPRDQRAAGTVHEHQRLPGAADVDAQAHTDGDVDHPLRHRRSRGRAGCGGRSPSRSPRPARPCHPRPPRDVELVRDVVQVRLARVGVDPAGRGASEPSPSCACWSDGPLCAFGRQLSPTFSWVCFSAAKATRCARSSSPSYCSIAASYACANVRWAFSSERCSVLGSSLCLAAPDRVVLGMLVHPVSRLAPDDRHPRDLAARHLGPWSLVRRPTASEDGTTKTSRPGA